MESLGATVAALGPVLATLGVLLGVSWEALGIILELCQSTFGGPKALGKRFGSDVCKYCKTLKKHERVLLKWRFRGTEIYDR